MEKTKKEESAEGEDAENGSAAQEDPRLKELREEISQFGEGPPSDLKEGSQERTEWFKRWLDAQEVTPGLNPATMSRDQMLEMIEHDPEMLAMAKAQGIISERAMRMVRLVSKEKLKPAMEAHPALKWDDRLQDLCGEVGRVVQDDPSDSTCQVKFRCTVSATVWLPLACLIETEGRSVRVVDSEESLREAVEAIRGMPWNDDIKQCLGQLGVALQDDTSDGTTRVTFKELGITTWLPTSVLTDEDVDSSTASGGEDEDRKEDRSVDDVDEKDESPSKKQRTD